MIGRPSWFQAILEFKGSVALVILPRIVVFTIFTLLVCLMHQLQFLAFLKIPGDLTNNVVYNLVLGLLLVFRTNTAYDHYWEGRKAWGALVVNSRNLAREIYLGVATPDPTESTEVDKTTVLRWIAAFAIATKLHLRQEEINDELKALLSPQAAQTLATIKNRPLEIALWLGHYFQQQYRQQHLDSNQLSLLSNHLNSLIEGLTSCERIAKTPIPPAYSIYLKRLIFIYCMFLPFQLVDKLGWWTAFVVATVSFILLGVEEIGFELEDPFGKDANDLLLDEICHTILNNIEEVLTFSPATILNQKNQPEVLSETSIPVPESTLVANA